MTSAICNPPSNPTNVYVVDDDVSFLTATARLLRATGHTVHPFDSPAACLKQLSVETPGCILVDLEMPGTSGLEFQSELARAEIRLPVIFLSGHANIPATVRAIRHGAEDFLTKMAPKEDLLNAVHRALARDVAQREERLRLHALRARFARLTAREHEVLAQVLQGKLNKQIAADLSIHERTVKLHRTSLMKKLQVRSVAELTRLVQAAGLFE